MVALTKVCVSSKKLIQCSYLSGLGTCYVVTMFSYHPESWLKSSHVPCIEEGNLNFVYVCFESHGNFGCLGCGWICKHLVCICLWLCFSYSFPCSCPGCWNIGGVVVFFLKKTNKPFFKEPSWFLCKKKTMKSPPIFRKGSMGRLKTG